MNALTINANPVTALPIELPRITLGIANAIATEIRKLDHSDDPEAQCQQEKLRNLLFVTGWKLDATGHAVEA